MNASWSTNFLRNIENHPNFISHHLHCIYCDGHSANHLNKQSYVTTEKTVNTVYENIHDDGKLAHAECNYPYDTFSV